MNQQIFIEKRPNDISASALADLIRRAHSVNIRKGLVYGTSEISDTKMEKTLLNSVCYVAYIGSEKRVVGTCTITDTELNRWYHHGKAAYIHLIAVDPEYAGMKIGSKMVEFVTKELRNQGGISWHISVPLKKTKL